MATTYCSNCGGVVDGVAFCATCGTAVASASEASAGATAPLAAPAAPNTGKSLQTGRLGFVDAIKSFFNNYVNFEGRATASAYWFAVLFIFLAGAVAGIVGSPLNDSNGSNPISSLLSLAFLLPHLSVGVRRLHDTGRSGHSLWWALLPIVGWIMVIVWLAGKSEPVDNKYGPRP
jgi:uncharacterized membrane protein YhaH (DUF805 family)